MATFQTNPDGSISRRKTKTGSPSYTNYGSTVNKSGGASKFKETSGTTTGLRGNNDNTTLTKTLNLANGGAGSVIPGNTISGPSDANIIGAASSVDRTTLFRPRPFEPGFGGPTRPPIPPIPPTLGPNGEPLIPNRKIPIKFAPEEAFPVVIKTVSKLSRFLKATAVGWIVGESISKLAEWIFQYEKQQFIRSVKDLAKRQVKDIAKRTVREAGKSVYRDVGNSISNIQPRVDLDQSRFNNALREYMKYTKKDIVDVVNQKAFWVAIGAFKKTHEASKSDITNTLEAPSKTAPGLSTAEFLALQRLRRDGIRNPKKSEVKKLARKFIARRKGAVKFLKSGWLPAIKALAPFAPQKRGGGSTGTTKVFGTPKGGAKAAPQSSNKMMAEAILWNSIVADGDAKSHDYMVNALNESMDEQAADMEAYVKRKMERNAQRFNRG